MARTPSAPWTRINNCTQEKIMMKEIEKKYLSKPEYQNDCKVFDPLLRFDLPESACLVYRHVTKRKYQRLSPEIALESIGIVVGIIDINEEIEVIIRWTTTIEQYTKLEFCNNFILIEDEI
jgi:hypothetical protein